MLFICFRGDAQRVRLGTIDIKTPSEHMQEIKIDSRIAHPNYSAKSKYNDIALIKLQKMAMINGHVRPACLCTEIDFTWTKSIATGFGRLEYGIVVPSFLPWMKFVLKMSKSEGWHNWGYCSNIFFTENEEGSVDLMKVQLSNIEKSDCHETYKVRWEVNKARFNSQERFLFLDI